jgi:phytoene dehydrogenase-like protein
VTERVDVVVVGAGLAGLRAAQLLHAAGREVVVLEGGDAIGGRVRTDRVDGFTLDRGFQLYNPAYPEGRRAWPDLRVHQFAPGIDVMRDGTLHAVADPRRDPGSLPTTLRSLRALGALRGTAALAAYGARLGTLRHPRHASPGSAAQPIAEALRHAGVDDAAMDGLVRPFLSGVLADEDLSVPRGVADDLLRTFLAGTPGLPDGGMAELPRRLAHGLDVRTATPARSVAAGLVRTSAGDITCDDVIVAVDDPAALLHGSTPTAWHALTTWYFAAAGLPGRHPRLLVSGDVGLANVAVVSDVARSYAPPGRQLVAASAVGVHDSAQAEDRARREAAVLLGVRPADLEPLAHYPIARALPVVGSGQPRALVASGVVLAGDHRTSPSINGALASGRRAAALLGCSDTDAPQP